MEEAKKAGADRRYTVSIRQQGENTKTTNRIKDADGNLICLRDRIDYPDGTKDVFQHLPGRKDMGGVPTSDVPLYGSEGVGEWPEDAPVIVVEGEKARDALHDPDSGFYALGTLGTGHRPNANRLEVLRNRMVILWPDADKKGHEHMERMAEALQGVAASVQWYTWRDAPEKGDAADHQAVQSRDEKALDSLLNDLLGARKWEPKRDVNPLLAGRVLLGEGMEHGFEPPEELEAGVLLKGRVHQIFSGPWTGKSFMALWLVKNAIARREQVLYLDMENGKRIISERLGLLGVDAAAVDEHMTYLPSPALTGKDGDVRAWTDLLDEVKPDLIVFDSWAGFLAAAGMEENSNDDIVRWSFLFTHPARNRGITTVILDHVPHDAHRSRGASRKKDEADVQWKLVKTQPFDRDSVGEIILFREKDRESWLPPSIKFSIGGGAGGFVLERSEGTVEVPAEDGFTPSMRKALNILGAVFGEKGATFSEWMKATGQAKSTFGLAKQNLQMRGRIRQAEDGRYFPTLDHGSSPIGPLDNKLDQSGPDGESSPVQQPYRVGLDGPPVGPRRDREDYMSKPWPYHPTGCICPECSSRWPRKEAS